MSTQLGGQPIYILTEGSSRKHGRDAQTINFTAAKAVASAVQSTLGPKGMDKMLVDSMGNIVITNDGSTILKEMDIDHPAAKIMVDIAKNQDDEVGDGTTSAVVITGELLRRAEDLIDQGIHPTVIVRGYRLALEKSQDILHNLAKTTKPDDISTLKKIAETAMSGKGVDSARSLLSDMVAKAVTAIKDNDGMVDIKNIKTEKIVGGKIDDSNIIMGVVIDKERVHPGMPKKIKMLKLCS